MAGPTGVVLLAGSFTGIGVSLLDGIDSGPLLMILLRFGGLRPGAADAKLPQPFGGEKRGYR